MPIVHVTSTLANHTSRVPNDLLPKFNAKAELQAIQAHEQEIEARRIELYAQLEMEDEAEEIAEHENVVKTLADIQENGLESFSFSAVDAMSEEEDGGNVV